VVLVLLGGSHNVHYRALEMAERPLPSVVSTGKRSRPASRLLGYHECVERVRGELSRGRASGRCTVHPLSAVVVVLAAGAVALGASACGGAGSPAVARRGHVAHTEQAQLLAFSVCMRKHGIPDFPDPIHGRLVINGTVGSPIQPQSPQFQAALKVCNRLTPQSPPVQQRHADSELLKAVRCMRAHGFTDLPDPKFEPGGGVKVPLPPSMLADVGTPRFNAARKLCGALSLPG
jgi:hypothetical protein